MEQQQVRKSVLFFVLACSLIIVFLLITLFQSRQPQKTAVTKKTVENEAQTGNLSQPKQQSHFNIQARSEASTIQTKSEEYYQAIPQLSGLPSGEVLGLDQITVKIFENKEGYVKETGKPSWSEGFADYKNKEVFLIESEELTTSVLPHEISHLFFDSYMGYERNDFNWLDEGLATLVQVKYDPDQASSFNQSMADIRSGNFIALKDLRSFVLDKQTPAAKINLYYAETVSLTSYLTNDWQRWKLLLENLKSKKGFNDSLKAAYNKNPASLQQNWLSYLKENKQSWEK